MILHAAAVSIGFALSVTPAIAADPAPSGMTASELAERLNAGREPGTTYVRARLEVKGEPGTVLQLQIKERRSRDGGEVLYQVLWPKERKGEAVLLRRSGHSVSGTLFSPPDTVTPLGASQLTQPFFGSNLSYEDMMENFFGWSQQAIVGTDTVNAVKCPILESKPGKGERASYGKVRSWIDTRRMIPLRVEKYSPSGKLVRRIDIKRVATDSRDRHIPADLIVHGPGGGSVTELDGSRIKHGVAFTEREFTPEGMKELSVPRGVAESDAERR